jgi:multidrug transporter EmrE-like cation transporter
VTTVAASVITWSITHSVWDGALAATASVLVVIAIARIVPRRVGLPMALGAVPAALVSALAGAVVSVAAVANLAFMDEYRVDAFDFWRGVAIAAVAVILAPWAAHLWRSGDSAARNSVSAAIAGPALVAGAISALAWCVEAVGSGAIDYVAVAAVGVGVAAYLVTLARPWRSSRMVATVAGTAIVSAQTLVVLGHIAVGNVDRLPALWTVGGAVIALGVAAWRYPRAALGPAIAVGTLAVPAAVLPTGVGWALWSAVVTAAVTAWTVLLFKGERRSLARWGLLPVAITASAIVPVVLWLSGSSLVRLYGEQPTHVSPMWWIAESAAVLAVLSLSRARVRAAWVIMPALVVMAGLVPAPVGWIGLAATGTVAGEMAIRWRPRWGLHPSAAMIVGTAAVWWSATERWSAAVSLAALAVSSLWVAVRSHRALGATWSPALVVAPLAGAVAVWLACTELGMDARHAVVIAAGTALAMPVAAVAARMDTTVAPFMVAIASVFGTLATLDLRYAAVVVLLACAAWYGLSVLGVVWARWVALGGLSVAAVLLLGSVGVETWEAYTALPAATLIWLGLWWMRKDPGKRSYEALAPGLGVALVPSYLALFAQPQTLARPLSLAFAALVLAIIGVARRWFAPLLATALTAIVLAIGQIVVQDALVPRWVSFAFVGGVILALGLVAERISKMR